MTRTGEATDCGLQSADGLTSAIRRPGVPIMKSMTNNDDQLEWRDTYFILFSSRIGRR